MSSGNSYGTGPASLTVVVLEEGGAPAAAVASDTARLVADLAMPPETFVVKVGMGTVSPDTCAELAVADNVERALSSEAGKEKDDDMGRRATDLGKPT